MSEIQKTIQSVSETTGKAIDAGTRVGAFIAKIGGEGIVQLGGSFADWARVYRYNNLLKLIDRVDEIHKARSVEGKTIPVAPKYLIPILENASLEEDSEIIDLWSGLLANAADPTREFEVRRLYIQILSNLDPMDAQILEFLANLNEELVPLNSVMKNYRNAQYISDSLSLQRSDCLLSLGNLARQNLIEDGWGETIESLDYGYAGFRVDNYKSNFSLSHLGRSLVDSCAVT